MRKIYFIYPKFGSTVTGGTLYDIQLCKYLKKIKFTTMKSNWHIGVYYCQLFILYILMVCGDAKSLTYEFF